MVRWSGPVGRPSDKARKKKYRIAAIVAVASLTAVFLVLQGLDSITGASELNNSSTLSLLRERPWDDAVADECEKAVNRLVMSKLAGGPVVHMYEFVFPALRLYLCMDSLATFLIQQKRYVWPLLISTRRYWTFILEANGRALQEN